MNQELRVDSGNVIVSRLFDVSDSIDLSKAESLWADHRHVHLTSPTKAVRYGVTPLDILVVDIIKLAMDMTGEVQVRLYDFGVIRLAFSFAVKDLSWQELIDRVGYIKSATENFHEWTTILRRICRMFASAFTGNTVLRPNVKLLQEDYLIVMVRSFNQTINAQRLLQTADFPPLLCGEERELSPESRLDLMRHRFSWYADDLVVLAWDRAFIYEPRGDLDVINILDVANAQLLEMRYYDELLDVELPRMYDLVQKMHRSRSFLMHSRRFANLARQFHTLVAEVTELRERVDNALEITEDVYLVKVYSAALESFRVPQINATVDRKLAIIRDTYTALYDEASASRSALMEAVIVILIVAEIVIALVR